MSTLEFKKVTPLRLIVFALACFALLPNRQAAAETPIPNPPAPGVLNTADGQRAMPFVSTGIGNSAFGAFAQFGNTTGSFNTACGAGALDLNNGVSNTAVGAAALLLNTTGSSNTAVGAGALQSNTDGAENIAIGNDTLGNNVSGNRNIVIGGGGAGFNIVGGNGNIYIGNGVSANGPFDESQAIRIRDSAPAAGGTTSQVFFAGIDGSTVGAVSAPVLVNPNGQLGTGVSSARFKKDIGPINKTSEAIYSLKPVTFHYKGDTTNTPQFGLIAEEVAKINPALILVDKEGKPYSVRYEQVNAMLLNEFLKDHKAFVEEQRKVQGQGAVIARQQKQIEVLTAGLQKVSAQLEVQKPVPQTALNNR